MKWTKESRAYMWASYYSEDGNWKVWDEDRVIKGGSPKKYYNTTTKRMEHDDLIKHFWKLQNLKTNEVIDAEFKTMKAAKEYAEALAEAV